MRQKTKNTPRKPSETGFAGRGGARERAEFSPQAETEQSGLCDDEEQARKLRIENDAAEAAQKT